MFMKVDLPEPRPHDGDELAGRDVERDAAQGGHRLFADEIFLDHVRGLNQRVSHVGRGLRVVRVCSCAERRFASIACRSQNGVRGPLAVRCASPVCAAPTMTGSFSLSPPPINSVMLPSDRPVRTAKRFRLAVSGPRINTRPAPFRRAATASGLGDELLIFLLLLRLEYLHDLGARLGASARARALGALGFRQLTQRHVLLACVGLQDRLQLRLLVSRQLSAATRRSRSCWPPFGWPRASPCHQPGLSRPGFAESRRPEAQGRVGELEDVVALVGNDAHVRRHAR